MLGGELEAANDDKPLYIKPKLTFSGLRVVLEVTNNKTKKVTKIDEVVTDEFDAVKRGWVIDKIYILPGKK